MLHMIGHAIVGLVVGLIARMLLPGADPSGIIVTAFIGMVGGWLGGAMDVRSAGIRRNMLQASVCPSSARCYCC